MSMITTKCPNCGAQMKLENNQLVCTGCRTSILSIVDAKIDADVTVMSPDEFAKKIEESKRQFVISTDNNLEVFDVQIKIYNKKIQDATEYLECRFFSQARKALKDVPEDIFSVARIHCLASFECTNEYELSNYNSSYDKFDLKEDIYFKNVLNAANEETKETYIKIAEYNDNLHKCTKELNNEILKVFELMKVNLYEEAVIYANNICRKYPNFANSWRALMMANYEFDTKYKNKFWYDLYKMEKCADYNIGLIPECIQKHLDTKTVAKMYLDPYMELYAKKICKRVKEDMEDWRRVTGKVCCSFEPRYRPPAPWKYKYEFWAKDGSAEAYVDGYKLEKMT